MRNLKLWTANDSTMTEKSVQLMLSHYCWIHSQRIRLPNSSVFGWESDMVGVTKARISHEYEIKLSFSDFRADRKKKRHDHIERFVKGEREIVERIAWGEYKQEIYPPANYFWYVVSAEIAKKAKPELPLYAGLIVVSDRLEISKAAPKLHRERLTDKQVWQILGSACGRFWSARRILTEHKIPFTDKEENAK